MRIEKSTLKNGETRYKARLRIGGHRLEVSRERKGDLQDALQRLSEQERRRKTGQPAPMAPITYGALIDKVLDQYAFSAQSKQNLTYNANRSRKLFGDVLVRELRAESIGAWLASLTCSAATKRHSLKAMRQVLAHGVEWQYLHASPAVKVTMPPRDTDTMHPFESWDEVFAVADAIGAIHAPYRALVLFACATGLRPQEWRALRWADVDRGRREATIRRAVQSGEVVERSAKNRSSLRIVHLQQQALDALASLPTPLNREQLIFPGSDGQPLSEAAFRGREKKPGPWRKALTAAGVAARTPRQMRHTYSSLALAAGVPIEVISQQMGHTDVQTTLDHYARFLPPVGEHALALLDAFAAKNAGAGRKRDANEAAR